jgi:hypothetical protein
VGVVLPLPRTWETGDLCGDRRVDVAPRQVGVDDAAPAARGGDDADDAVGVLDDVVRAVRERAPADLLVVGGQQLWDGDPRHRPLEEKCM